MPTNSWKEGTELSLSLKYVGRGLGADGGASGVRASVVRSGGERGGVEDGAGELAEGRSLEASESGCCRCHCERVEVEMSGGGS